MLTLFNMDIRNNVLAIANKIPIIEKWVPDPPPDPAAPGETAENPPAESKEQATSSASTIKELKAQLTAGEEKLKKAEEEKAAEVSKAEALQKQVEELKGAAETAAATEEDEDPYLKKVTDLAKLYAGMKASKAAPIMENLTTDEMVQIFSVMSNSSKSAILEKWTPKSGGCLHKAKRNNKFNRYGYCSLAIPAEAGGGYRYSQAFRQFESGEAWADLHQHARCGCGSAARLHVQS
ncbi:hypothetical protein ACFSQ7_21705 [Paenibacillus rhizoplanae]